MTPDPESEKLERLITMALRLIEAMQADIVALQAGQPQAMASLDPEIQRLSMLYSREAQTIDPIRTKAAPEAVRKRLAAATAKFRETLTYHQRLLTRMRHASEGIIKAIADEVQRQRAPTTTYAPPKAGYRPANVAMIYNGVV
jgi:signal transduction histidine kinase